MADEFDPAQMSDEEILTLPESNVPAAKLGQFLARRTAVLEEKESAQSARDFDLLHDDRKKSDRAAKEREEQLIFQQYLVAMQVFRDREDEMIDAVEAEHRRTLRRLEEIDAHAIKLRDGRRAYVDGNEFRDQYGVLLRGEDKREAETMKTRTSSTWAEESEWKRRDKLEIAAIDNMRENRTELDAALNNSANMTDSERAAILKHEKTLLATYETQTAAITNAYQTDSSAEQAAARSLSFASTLDGDKKGPTIARRFSDAASGQDVPRSNDRSTAAPALQAPAPSGR